MRLTSGLSSPGRLVHPALAALSLIVALLSAPAWAQQAGSGPAWTALKPQQQQILAPLQKDWSALDAGRKEKWLEIATRYPAMPADQQARMQQRMAEWARMTPEQRGQARVNFQQAQTVPPPNRQAQWEAYQALPKERREALARQGAASTPSVARPATPAGKLRSAPLDAQAPKANSAPATAVNALPRPVGPTLVQTGPGASTRLITQPPPPKPAASGPQAKIDVSANAIDRTTLLPKQGPQAAVPAPVRKPVAPVVPAVVLPAVAAASNPASAP